jgi:mono/diheme cytochrome c family protein
MRYAITTFVALQLFLAGQRVSAQTTKWVAPAAANAVKNPVPATPAAIAEAKNMYTTTCAPCHGAKGKGDGPAAIALNPKPADHTSKTIQGESDGSLFWKITNGRGAMQSYKSQFTDKQRWELVDYIRTLKK